MIRGVRFGLMATAVLVFSTVATLGAVHTKADTASTALTFSTPQIVDPFREGFEPDISVDQHSGAMYSSVPNGTPGTSTLWRSDDGGRQWRLVEGTVGGAEPSNCPPIAGGDTELALDPVSGSVYYADLQPLTNFNASVSDDQGRTWTCNPLSVPDTGVDRQWYAIDSNGGTTAVGDGVMYFDYDDTTQSPNPPTGNILVVNATTNGLQFGSTCVANVGCAGPSARITADEGLPGNLVVNDVQGSPYQHSIYALHTSSDVGGVILTKCTGAASGVPANAIDAANYCLDTTADTEQYAISSHWKDVTVYQTDVNGAQTHIESNNFATIAIDSAGNLYALWVDYPGNIDTTDPVQSTNNYTGPGRLMFSYSTDGGDTWATAQSITDPSTMPNIVMPWLTAGSSGRVAVAWYGAAQATAPDGVTYGPDALTNGVWNVYVAENLDVLNGGTWNTQMISNHPAKLGEVSTEGLQLPTGPDRSLGDFMKISHDANGALDMAYVDDNTEIDQSFQDYGPVVAVHQTSGPSLIAGKTVPVTDETYNQGVVSQAPGTAVAHLNSMDISGPPHLDITGASVSLQDPTHLKVTLTVNDPNLANDLGPDTTIGGASEDAWMVRWDFDPPSQPANTIPGAFYTEMVNSTSNGLQFFDGPVVTTPNPLTNPTLYTFAYPGSSSSNVVGSINGNTITMIVPTADVGGPVAGDTLYDVQGTTAVENVPPHGSGDPTDPIPFFGGLGLYNQGDSVVSPIVVDQSPTFDAPLGTLAVATPESPAAAVLIASGLVAGGALVAARRRRRGLPE